MAAFSFSSKDKKLYGVDDKNRLHYIDLVAGAAINIDGFDLGTNKVVDLSIDDTNNILYAVTKDRELISLDLKNKKN